MLSTCSPPELLHPGSRPTGVAARYFRPPARRAPSVTWLAIGAVERPQRWQCGDPSAL